MLRIALALALVLAGAAPGLPARSAETAPVEAPPDGDSEAPADPQAPGAASEPEEDSEGRLTPVLSRFGIRLYGRINLDMSYDTDKIDTGNFARQTDPQRQRSTDSGNAGSCPRAHHSP